MSSQTKGRTKNKWENDKRHYCAACNAWMGSDRHSIALHENGKKHKENVDFQLTKHRKEKQAQEKQQKLLTKTLQQIEQSVSVNRANDQIHYGLASGSPMFASAPVFAPPPQTGGPSLVTSGGSSQAILQSQAQPQASAIGNKTHSVTINIGSKRPLKPKKSEELNLWHSRRKQRESNDADDDEDINGEKSSAALPPVNMSRKRKRVLMENEGHYTALNKTFLEGQIYSPLFEEDMPVQIWTGVSKNEMRREEMAHLWKDGLVIKVHKSQSSVVEDVGTEEISCDVAYLRSPDDSDETLERQVEPFRIRLLVGQDEMLPSSVQEARIALEGLTAGQEEDNCIEEVKEEIDENTGFTKFTTVSVTRTTQYQLEREERERKRQRLREKEEQRLQSERDLEMRRMEEAKHASVDDSALGAYDVWGSKKGYKGVDISTKITSSIGDYSQPLATGKVDFKKKSTFKSKDRKKSIRRTTADDV